jgi:hypothetical protein
MTGHFNTRSLWNGCSLGPDYPILDLGTWEPALQLHWLVVVRTGLPGQLIGSVYVYMHELFGTGEEAALAAAVTFLHG